MSDAQDRIARLATEAQQRADVAGVQAAWQEGRAHGLREAAAITATATDARSLRSDVCDYIETLKRRAVAAEEAMHLLLRDGEEEPSLGVGAARYDNRRHTLRQVAEELRALLDADEPEEGES